MDKEQVTPFDLLKKKERLTAEMSKPAAIEIAAERLNICRRCPHFGKITQRCKICKCFMPAKVNLSGARCALPHPDFPGETRKWESLVSDE